MDQFNLELLVGFVLSGGAFGAVIKLLPILLEWLTKRRSGQTTLTESALKASGMSLESLIIVVGKLEEMVNMFESRIEKQQTEYEEDFAALKKRYEEEITLLIERHKARAEELLDEIKALKKELSKYRTMKAVEVEK